MTHLPAHTPKDDQGEGMSEIAEELAWQDIGTSPKDGRFILVFSPELGGTVALASWQGRNERARWFGIDDCGLRFDGNVTFATHWMPLPAHPPLTDEAKLRRSKALDELGALDGCDRPAISEHDLGQVEGDAA